MLIPEIKHRLFTINYALEHIEMSQAQRADISRQAVLLTDKLGGLTSEKDTRAEVTRVHAKRQQGHTDRCTQ